MANRLWILHARVAGVRQGLVTQGWCGRSRGWLGLRSSWSRVWSLWLAVWLLVTWLFLVEGAEITGVLVGLDRAVSIVVIAGDRPVNPSPAKEESGGDSNGNNQSQQGKADCSAAALALFGLIILFYFFR